jgi:hypothetical protein
MRRIVHPGFVQMYLHLLQCHSRTPRTRSHRGGCVNIWLRNREWIFMEYGFALGQIPDEWNFFNENHLV